MTQANPSCTLISLTAVDKRFAQGTQALAGLTFQVAQGEFLSLLGPSGCGKSTALRLIAGLTSPSAGTLSRPELDPMDGGLAFVFQEPTLMPWATVADNVGLPLKLAHRPAAQIRELVAQALAGVGLSSFAPMYPRELSGGMKMRASIARALVTRPRLLLMDEPFAALDEITRLRLNDDLLALRLRLGLTVVFVTHSVYESVYLSDRVLVMSARPGRVLASHVIQPHGPRDESWRTSARYGECCRLVSASLRQALPTGI